MNKEYDDLNNLINTNYYHDILYVFKDKKLLKSDIIQKFYDKSNTESSLIRIGKRLISHIKYKYIEIYLYLFFNAILTIYRQSNQIIINNIF